MNFLNFMPDYFIGCDPDTRHAAYAALDREGNVIRAWTKESNGNETIQSNVHRVIDMDDQHMMDTLGAYLKTSVAAVEGQQVYRDDKKSNPADLIKLARSSGISCAYLSKFVLDIQIVLPNIWKGNRQKHAHQADILTKLGQTPVIKGKGDHRYAVPKEDFLRLNQTQYKHVIDAIGIAMWLRDSYIWEFKKRGKLKDLNN